MSSKGELLCKNPASRLRNDFALDTVEAVMTCRLAWVATILASCERQQFCPGRIAQLAHQSGNVAESTVPAAVLFVVDHQHRNA